MLKLFANSFWIFLPGTFQKKLSYLFSLFFETKASRLIIFPYLLLYGLSSDYLVQFEPESGQRGYDSYSDFFKRRFKKSPALQGRFVWPCEGYICDWGPINERTQSRIKGQELSINEIFLIDQKSLQDYYFLNVFLHNHNYHRVHMPTDGIIKNITRVPGDLYFLRPWFYKRQDVSYPAYKNERLTVEIEDSQGKPWFITLVGGFGVGTIELAKNVFVNSHLQIGEEIGMFKLGSTVCLASPYQIKIQNYLQKIFVGQSMLS